MRFDLKRDWGREEITEIFILLGKNDRVTNNLSGKQLNHISIVNRGRTIWPLPKLATSFCDVGK